MTGRLEAVAARIGRRRAGQLTAQLAAALQEQVAGAVVTIEDDQLVIAARGLRVRSMVEPALRWIAGVMPRAMR